MKIEKIRSEELKRAYCASCISVDDKKVAMFASEASTDEPGDCLAFWLDDLNKKELVWDNAGGCMSIIPIPGKDSEFLAVQEFYLKQTPSKSKLVWGKREKDGSWKVVDFLHLPFLHRFDIYTSNGVNYLVCATIAEDKKDKDDWSKAGKIYVGLLPNNPEEKVELTVLKEGLFRNHGYYRNIEDGQVVGYFGSDQGVLRVTPPTSSNPNWQTTQVLTGPIGEIALVDLDQDGEMEMMTIEPFHGNTIRIYKKILGVYTPVYTYSNKIDFAHTLVGTTLAGIPSFVAGIRRLDAEIVAVQFINGEFVETIIDKGVGPANLCVVNQEDKEFILAANHTKNECAIYVITK